MCNAWNHSYECTCGFGGFGHLGRRGPGIGVVPRLPLPREWRKYESYVNPNAKCPVCGDAVFFYQSPDGGRVFFDELGPPWPKHPCTDNSISRTAASIVAPVASATSSRRYKWLVAGWSPFIVGSAVGFSPELLRISGSYDGKQIDLYVRKRDLSTSADPLLKQDLRTSTDPRELVSKSLVHIKPSARGEYRLAMLLPSLKAIEVLAYESSIAAMPLRPSSRNSRRNVHRRT
jgi:hypothetical protein